MPLPAAQNPIIIIPRSAYELYHYLIRRNVVKQGHRQNGAGDTVLFVGVTCQRTSRTRKFWLGIPRPLKSA